MVVKAIATNPRAGKIQSEMPKADNGNRRFQKQMESVSKVEEKSILIAKELKFVKSLAGNDVKLRRKVMKNLKIWLATRSRSSFAFTDTDFLRLWKGLFYCMWMSDKPLTQENLADEIASLVRCFDDLSVALQYFGTFLETMCIEWFGIDHWRMDKFMMLVRRCTRQMLTMLHEAQWPMDQVSAMMKHIEKTILNADKSPFGLTKHFDDLLLEEIAKVCDGEIEPEIVHLIVNTYAIRLLSTNDMRMIKHITSSIFHPLLYQSELGQDYQEKFDLWKKTNFITGNIDDVDFEVRYEREDGEQGDEDGSEGRHNDKEKVFDPRAGQVDVVINEIRFDALKIVEMFENNRFKPFVTSKGKKQMKMLVKQYKKFSEGMFPLGIQSMESIAKKDYAVDIDEQIGELENYQKELVGDKGSKKQKRKELAKLKSQEVNASAKTSESNVWTETEETPKDSKREPTDTAVSKKKTRKKISKTQIKEEKLKKLKIKRDAKLEAIKQRKQESKSKKPKVILEQKQEDLILPKSDGKVTSSEPNAPRPTKQKGAFEVKDEWSEPLKEGETEYFIPSRKTKLKEINKHLKEESPSDASSRLKPSSLVKNPFATPKNLSKLKRSIGTPQTDGPAEKKKRVKIALNKNIFQDLHQHIQQVKSSPQVPYDSSKKPPKGALKPNLMPSPINPFYRKKIGLKLNKTL
ncbi:ribosomal RNA processing protein 1 homolog [Ochlerotatus camptorhynchus]|uniref:ribosomal RNA processing protein 1 homolog n=1 Tax=Ochlerotatus camptorhynchus TaxID=644619 RepID=UPI0031E049A4